MCDGKINREELLKFYSVCFYFSFFFLLQRDTYDVRLLIVLCLGQFRVIEAVFNHPDNSSAKLWELGLLWSEI